MNYKAIPDELKSIPQWVCVRNGSKVPMRADANAAASSSDPSTWSDYRTAEEAVLAGRYDNLGFVFNLNGIVGIDIDCGFDGGILSPIAIDIMRACGSYTEKSRSGRGVHILVKGVLPFKGKNNGNGVEIYQTGRYFITTGRKLVYGNMIENQNGIDYVVQRYFPEALRSGKGPISQKIYRPIYPRPKDGIIKLRPKYPPIGKGGRNISLTSLAGQLHNQGYDRDVIYRELLYANEQACNPPLDEGEVESIVASVTRYER